MQNTILILIVAVMAIGGYFVYNSMFTDLEQEVAEVQSEVAVDPETMTDDSMSLEDGPSVTPISHATMVLTWMDRTIYVDPVGDIATYSDLMAPDLVLLTDIHGDHLNVATLAGIIAGETVIVAPQAVYDELPEELQVRAMVMDNGETTDLLGFSLEATPMYNFPETDDSRHTKGRGNGYIMEANDFRVLIAGDTGPIPELRAMNDIDMAFVPMNTPYTMTVAEAAELVVAMEPGTAVPYHYRNQGGTLSDVAEFKRLVEAGTSNTRVLLLNWYPEAPEAATVNNTAAAAAAEEDVAEPAGEERVFNVSGVNFAFDVTEMRVNEGDRVTINFESAEGFHDWVVDEFDAATEQVRPGTPTSVTFVADQAGTYEYYCSVGQHRAQGMVGTLIVE